MTSSKKVLSYGPSNNLDEKKNKKNKMKTQNTNNRYAPLDNIDESFNSSSGDNLLQSEINVATTQD